MDFIGGPYKYTLKTWAYVKGIDRVFNWPMCLVGIVHLKFTTWCQISTLIFIFVWGDPINMSCKSVKGLQCSFPLEVRPKVVPGSLNDLSARGEFCTWCPQQGVKYQLWYLYFFKKNPITYISYEQCQTTAKFFPTGGLDQMYCPGL